MCSASRLVEILLKYIYTYLTRRDTHDAGEFIFITSYTYIILTGEPHGSVLVVVVVGIDVVVFGLAVGIIIGYMLYEVEDCVSFFCHSRIEISAIAMCVH